MNTLPQNRGFIRIFVFLLLAGAVLFVFFTFFAKYFVPGALVGGLGGPAGSSSPFSGLINLNSGGTSYQDKTNPLLDFGTNNNGSYTYNVDRSTPNTDGSGRSPYAGKINLSSANSSAIQTFEEYVTLDNDSSAPVNITGWTLTNGKGSRPIQNIQNNYVYPAADSATIGLGTEFLNPTGIFQTGSIVLKPGDMAYLVTGRPFAQYPFSINTSFRENICVGYLKNYPFTPSLNNNCPSASSDPLVRTVTDECYDYLRSLGRCVDPTKYDKDRFDHDITSQCQQFIRPRLNYAGCVDSSKNLSNFSTNTWRIFLGKDKELSANSRETITLYDTQGLIVDQVSY